MLHQPPHRHADVAHRCALQNCAATRRVVENSGRQYISLYYMDLFKSTTTYGCFVMYKVFSTIRVFFLCIELLYNCISKSILYIAPPILHKMVPYIYTVSYVLSLVHLMYTNYFGVLHKMVQWTSLSILL